MRHGLGEILAESGDLTLRRLRRASEWRRLHGGSIERALLETGAVTEEVLLDALSKACGLPAASRDVLASAPREVVDLLPVEARRRLRALPFRLENGVLLVAAADPGNAVLETGLTASTGFDVRLYVTPEPILDEFLEARSGPGAAEVPEPTEVPAVTAATEVTEAPRTPQAAAAEEPSAAPVPGPDAPPPAAGSSRADRPAAPGPPPPLSSVTATGPIARLARALLAEAIDLEAETAEVGLEKGKGFVRTLAAGRAATSRPLPPTVVPALVAWFVDRSRPSGPFDEGGIVLSRDGRRRHVEVSPRADGGVWLIFGADAAAAPLPPAADGCTHEGSGGEVFCPRCGAPV